MSSAKNIGATTMKLRFWAGFFAFLTGRPKFE